MGGEEREKREEREEGDEGLTSREDLPAPAPLDAGTGETGAVLQEEAPAQKDAAGADDLHCFLDRELSWLQFNLRVLHQAGDLDTPLLERLKFLGIYHSNLEEFFMVRVGSLIHRAMLLPGERDEKTQFTAKEQLSRIMAEVSSQQETKYKIYRGLLKDLKAAGIDVVDFRKLSKMDEVLTRKFFSDIRQLLSPRIVDAEHPFPFIGNKEIWLAVTLKRSDKSDDVRLGLVPIARVPLYRVCEVDGRQKVILTAEMVAYYASLLFKKQEVRQSVLFQVTRNADVFIEDDLDGFDADFRASMEKMLRKRKRQQPVRLVFSGKPSARLRAMLVKALKVPEQNVFIQRTPFDLSFGSGLKKGPGMKFAERRPRRTVQLKRGEFFPYLEKKDILLSFPFQSMNPFVDMLYEAADDPDVVSIQITLYRLAASSQVAAALAYAADRGKNVLCLLELRARFDEQNNIDYSEVLEDTGCTVIYGLPDRKIHSKLCLITRQKDGKIQYITQVGTGNYNETTSEQYTDLSVITSREAVGRDAAQVFESLALGQTPAETEAMWIAPNSFRPRVLEMIGRETAKGPRGRIVIKVNSLNDLTVMRALIAASQAGVPIELYIRGICCLRPGIPGFTDNISVRSVVGRHLEHSRIFAFGEGEELRLFVGSGDLLNRNTRRRVEAFIECVTPETREGVLEVLQALREDRERSWIMQPDGSYVWDRSEPGTASQDRLYRYFSERVIEALPAPAPVPEGERGLLGMLRRFFGGGKAADPS